MNEDFDRLQRSLEQATAAGSASEGGLDGQTESLREAWIAFGQLLETAQPPAALSPERFAMPIPPPARPRRWLLPVAGVLAASLLIGVATSWMLRGTNLTPDVTPAQTAISSRPIAAHTQKQPQAAPTASEPAWDDSLDEQIAQVGQQMRYVKQDELARLDALGVMQYRMEQVRTEVQADKL